MSKKIKQKENKQDNKLIVYKYYKLNHFKKMIESKSLWLTDITKSNDTTELEFVGNILKGKILNDCFYQKPKYMETIDRDELKSILENELNYLDNTGTNKIHTQWVSCFSENGDLLSQWRGYAESPKLEGDELAEIKDSDKDPKILERYGVEGGISVGYSYKLLKELRPKKETSDFLSIGKVEYTNGKSAKCLNDSSKQIAKIIKNEIKNKHKIDESNSIWGNIQNEYEEAVIKIGAYIKNKFFKEENEWRICHWGLDYYGPNTGDIPLDAKNILLSDKNDPKRHYEIQFNKNIDKYIKKIIIGPKCSMSKDDILKLLKDNGIKLPEDSIEYSKGYGVYVDSKNQK